jgi:hypothetical protein
MLIEAAFGDLSQHFVGLLFLSELGIQANPLCPAAR